MPARRQDAASGRTARKSAMNNPFCPSSAKVAGGKPSPKTKAVVTPVKAKKAVEASSKATAAAKITASKAKLTATKGKASSELKAKQAVVKKAMASTTRSRKPKSAESPRKNTAEVSKKKVEAPMKPETPKKKPESPQKRTGTTGRDAGRQTRIRPETPKKKPETPTRRPETPKKKPESPIRRPETPKKKPETPSRRPETPKKKPEMPIERPETPKKRSETPTRRSEIAKRPESPRRPETPKKKPETPKKAAGTTKGESKKDVQPEAKLSREERMKQRATKDAEEREEGSGRSSRRSEVELKKRASSQSPRGSERKKRATEAEETKGKDNSPSSPDKAFDMRIKLKTYAGKKGQTGKAKAATGKVASEQPIEEQEEDEKPLQAKNLDPKSGVIPPLEDAPRRIICLDCGEPFTDRKLLASHKRLDCKSIFPEHKTDSGQKVVMCGQCGLHCPSKDAFLEHSEKCQKQSVKDDKLRKCNYCFPAVWFPGFPLFLNHMREAHNLKPGHNLFMCNKCSSLFMTKLDHQTHKGTKCEQSPDAPKDPFDCTKCKATFNTVLQLKSHSAKCKADRPGSIVCNYCNSEKSFNNEKELHNHKVECHQGVGLNLFTCTVCGKCFDYDKERWKHQASHQTSPRVEVPMADIMKKIGELPKVGSRERGFGSNADVASPFITELSATNGSHAFAIKIDTSSGKPKVTVGLDEPVAPNVSTPVVSRIKAMTKGIQSTSSPPKLSISTGKATPISKPTVMNNKVGLVIGSLNLVSAQPVGPKAGSISAKKAAASGLAGKSKDAAAVNPPKAKKAPQAKLQEEIEHCKSPEPEKIAENLKRTKTDSADDKLEETRPKETKSEETKPKEAKSEETKPKETKSEETKLKESQSEKAKPKEAKPEEAKPEEAKPQEAKTEEKMIDKPEEEKPEEQSEPTAKKIQIPTVVSEQENPKADKTPDSAPAKKATKGKQVLIIKKASARSMQDRIEAEMGKGAVVLYPDPKAAKRSRSPVSAPVPMKRSALAKAVPAKKEVPVKTKMLQAKTPAGRPVMVPIAITQGIHVEPVSGNVVKCSECELHMSSMVEVANHACSRCMRCLTIMNSLTEVADHVCTGTPK